MDTELKQCIYRWFTTYEKPSHAVCGNHDEYDVYDSYCTDKIHAECKYKVEE